jgi:hypothetical protein
MSLLNRLIALDPYMLCNSTADIPPYITPQVQHLSMRQMIPSSLEAAIFSSNTGTIFPCHFVVAEFPKGIQKPRNPTHRKTY